MRELSLPAATMVTTMLVDVDELCSSTVTSTPIIMQHTGFCSNSLFVNALPAVRPVNKRASTLR